MFRTNCLCLAAQLALAALPWSLCAQSPSDKKPTSTTDPAKGRQKLEVTDQQRQLAVTVRQLQLQLQKQIELLAQQEKMLRDQQSKAQQDLGALERQRAQARAQYSSALEQAQAARALADYRKVAASQKTAVSPYWIGVHCEPASLTPVKPKNPKLSRVYHKGGLKVVSVSDGGSARKAGVKVGDVIVRAGGEEMQSINDLLRVVGKRKGKPIEVDIIRAEKIESLTVQPEKRPENFDRAKLMLDWSRSANQWRSFPKDLQITVQKKGDAPASVHVADGKQSWLAKANDLTALPQKHRPWVKRVLAAVNDPRGALNWDWAQFYLQPRVSHTAQNWFREYFDDYHSAAENYNRWKSATQQKTQQEQQDLNKKIDALTQQVQKLQKMVEELSKK